MTDDFTLVGRRITEVRPMTAAEVEAEGWYETIHGVPTALVLDDGTVLYPSQDPEGNGGGALFGVGSDGLNFALA